ncbi:16S rRNA (cytosine(967)-C(5))-methyltransferase RsmB [Serpentinicella sp. ANB-PHB4]|uniref:16S rRNA (cytosine(967)-C(5))-methyltransferase RsmB n=1 Tax=Serpentinicella sp. ANB-PHB4 TaxID=3074076 RepID=UPI0028596323|nr:16S rRNA (cytosine(967)-C(5))-methyltransferase RsmB [Serpentinicella sp. ANB-PHB4]MDR5658320.1 16S rRNA (cytosine(967)-C(5))-methyltransferase RsmB [Serpentinicella sp. ANB-PHB4]
MNTREIALNIVYEIESKKAFSNLLINKKLKGKNATAIDRNFITEIVYGTLENLIYIDYIITQFSSVKINKINLWTLSILRLGIYQIMFLDKVPDFAAVNESVNLSKKYNKRTSGFINAILRNIIRNKENITLPDKKKDIEKYLMVKYSHPQWMVQRFLKYFDKDFTEELLKANNERPDLYIRVNTLKISIEECIGKLEGKGLKVTKCPLIKEAVIIRGINKIEEMEEYREGYIHIQDFGSMLVSKALEPKESDFIIDMCCAPGGKTTHIAQLMNNKGKILARDIYDHKLKLVEDNSSRLGVKIIHTQKFDGMKQDDTLIEKADKVLVDAPCSGLGIIRRKPEIKYRKTPDDINELMKMQFEILKNAAIYLKPGGELLYSTCTIDPNENDKVISKFLEQNKNFEIVDIESSLGLSYKGIGTIQLYPNIHHTDGFFIAKLKKII